MVGSSSTTRTSATFAFLQISQGFQLYSTMPPACAGAGFGTNRDFPRKSSQRVRVRDTKGTGRDSTFGRRGQGGSGVPCSGGLPTRVHMWCDPGKVAPQEEEEPG